MAKETRDLEKGDFVTYGGAYIWSRSTRTRNRIEIGKNFLWTYGPSGGRMYVRMYGGTNARADTPDFSKSIRTTPRRRPKN